jgi:hypothetical protein
MTKRQIAEAGTLGIHGRGNWLIDRQTPRFMLIDRGVSTTYGTTHRLNLGLAIDTHFVFFLRR